MNKHAAFAKLALAMTHFVLTQGCLVPWMNEGRRVRRSAQFMFPMGEMAFSAIKTRSGGHKMNAEFGFEFFGVLIVGILFLLVKADEGRGLGRKVAVALLAVLNHAGVHLVFLS